MQSKQPSTSISMLNLRMAPRSVVTFGDRPDHKAYKFCLKLRKAMESPSNQFFALNGYKLS